MIHTCRTEKRWLVEGLHRHSISLFAFVILSMLCLAAAQRSLADHLSTGFKNKMKIAFVAYNKQETLTNFPVLVMFGTNIANFAYDQFVSTNGWELRFADSSETTNLNYEIEQWSTGGSSYVWVQVPFISGTNTCVWAYWGNTNTAQQAFTTNGAAWDSTFAGVWHLKEATGVTNADSTTNKNSGTPVNSPYHTNGVVGGALTFNGSSSYLNMTNRATANVDNWTLEAWISPGVLPQGPSFAVYNGSDQAGYGFGVGNGTGSSGNNLQGLYGSIAWPSSTYTFTSTGAWCHVVMESFAGSVSFYVNGAKTGTVTKTASVPQNYFAVGNEIGGGRYFNGSIDEVRVSSIARSSNWVWACYMTAASNSVFSQYGKASIFDPGTVFTIK